MSSQRYTRRREFAIALKGTYSILVNKISGVPRKPGTGYATRRSPSGTLYYQKSPKPPGPEAAHQIFKWMQACSAMLDRYWTSPPRPPGLTDHEYYLFVLAQRYTWDRLNRHKGCTKSTDFQCYKYVNMLRMLYCMPGLVVSPNPNASYRVTMPRDVDRNAYPTLQTHRVWYAGLNMNGSFFTPEIGVIPLPATEPDGRTPISCPTDAAERICPPEFIKISARHSPGGFITPAGTTQHEFLTHPSYNWLPDPGYTYRRHYVDEAQQPPSISHTFLHVIQDHNICVDFAPDDAAPCPDNCGACCEQYRIVIQGYLCNWGVPYNEEFIVTRIAPGSCNWRLEYYHPLYGLTTVILYCSANTWIVWLQIPVTGATAWHAYTNQSCPPVGPYYTCVSGCRFWVMGNVTVHCVGEPPAPGEDCPAPCGPGDPASCDFQLFPSFTNMTGTCSFLSCTNWNGRAMVTRTDACHWIGIFRTAVLTIECHDSRWWLRLDEDECTYDEWSAPNLDGCPPVVGWTQTTINHCTGDVSLT